MPGDQAPAAAAGAILGFAAAVTLAATMPLPFSGAAPRLVRAALAIALVPALAASLSGASGRTWTDLTAQAFAAAALGAGVGVCASVVAAGASAAGALIDGALASQPFGGEAFSGSTGPFGRLYAVAFAATFFGSGAFDVVVEHLAEALRAASPHAFSAAAVAALASACFAAALTLAAPAIGAQLLSSLVAGTVARTAQIPGAMFLTAALVVVVALPALLAGAGPLWGLLRALALHAAQAGNAWVP